MMTPILTILESAAATFKERNKTYGDAYNSVGDVLDALLPLGVSITGPDEFRRFSAFLQCVGKLHRYAQNLQAGGHADSAHDLVVYAAMLESQTEEHQ